MYLQADDVCGVLSNGEATVTSLVAFLIWVCFFTVGDKTLDLHVIGQCRLT